MDEKKDYEFTIYVTGLTREEAESLMESLMLEVSNRINSEGVGHVVGGFVEVENVQENAGSVQIG